MTEVKEAQATCHVGSATETPCTKVATHADRFGEVCLCEGHARSQKIEDEISDWRCTIDILEEVRNENDGHPYSEALHLALDAAVGLAEKQLEAGHFHLDILGRHYGIKAIR